MEKCRISSNTTNSSRTILTSTTNSDAAAVVGLVAIILVCFVFLIRAVLRLLLPRPARPANMSAPVEESLDQYGMFTQYPYNQIVVVGPQQPNDHLIHLIPCQNNHLVHSHLLSSIPLCYIGLYLLVCAEQMPEDVPVQESVQCLTNVGKAVTVIGGKEYRPPANN